MSSCNRVQKERLFIGEAGFKGVWSLIEKHRNSHPNLGQSITATELRAFGRTSNSCLQCRTNEDILSELFSRLFTEDDSIIEEAGTEIAERPEFCSDRCERIQSLKDRGVKVILGYDGTNIHNHPLTARKALRKKFKRIHWNCPHDGSNFRDQTLPSIIKNFFISAGKSQENGDRIHVTLAQPITPDDKSAFYQGYVYNICDAAESSGYSLYAKRKFDSNRYPGYEHEQTRNHGPAGGAERLREFVFIKGALPNERRSSSIKTEKFYGSQRTYYERTTDDESSSYSS